MNNAISSADKVYGNVIDYLFNPLLELFTAIMFIYFLYGVLRYIMAMSDGSTNDEINKGKRHLFWGMVGLLIIFSIGGILSMIDSTIGGWFH